MLVVPPFSTTPLVVLLALAPMEKLPEQPPASSPRPSCTEGGSSALWGPLAAPRSALRVHLRWQLGDATLGREMPIE